MIRYLTISALLTLAALPAAAEDLAFKGAIFSHSNDLFIEPEDRWRTANSQGSFLFARGDGLLEVRIRPELITPWAAQPEGRADRPAAAILGLGIAYHARAAGLDLRIGGEVQVLGEQTRLFDVQRLLHGVTGGYDLEAEDPARIGNGVSAQAEGEVARAIGLGAGLTVRPFAEASLGAETLLRGGGDLILPLGGAGDLPSGPFLRDTATGSLSFLPDAPDLRVGIIVGGDVAAVGRSETLRETGPATAKTWRTRLRAGLYAAKGSVSAFAGATRLGPEYEGQPEGQTLTTFSVGFAF